MSTIPLWFSFIICFYLISTWSFSIWDPHSIGQNTKEREMSLWRLKCQIIKLGIGIESTAWRYNCPFCFLFSYSVEPSLITTADNQTVIEGTKVTFYCNASGNPSPKITWSKDGKILTEGETLSFEANRNQSGEYWCSAENGLSVTVNASAHLDVQCKYSLMQHYYCRGQWNKWNK